MKRCPTCSRTYADESLTFCMADGSLLSAPYDAQAKIHRSNAAPTEVMSSQELFESAQPPATAAQYFAPTIPNQFLTGQERRADKRFNAPWSPTAEQGEFLIEHGARVQTPVLYLLMRIVISLIGAFTAYALILALQRFRMSNEIYWVIRIIQKNFIGILLAVGQWALLRKYLKPMWPWILITVITIFITTFIDYALIGLIGDRLFLSNKQFLQTTAWSVVTQINSAVPWLFLGVAQWLFLQMRVRGAWLWIVAAIVAELLFQIADRFIIVFGPPQAGIASFVLVGICAGFAIGTTQAFSLLYFRRKRTSGYFQGV